MTNKRLKLITDKDLMIFLVACGLEVKHIEKEKGKNRSLVYFENTEELQEAILNYTNRSIEVNLSDYIAAEKRVTTLLHTQKQI